MAAHRFVTQHKGNLDQMVSPTISPIGRVSAGLFAGWALASINSNLKRAILGEYIVHLALETASTEHEEWNWYDVAYADLKIEVKTSGFVTPPFAETKRKPVPSFDIKKRVRAWENDTNKLRYYDTPSRPSDVYIFAVLCGVTKQDYDPFDLSCWRFVVAPTVVLNSTFGDQLTVSLPRLRQLFPYLRFDQLRHEIDRLISEQRS